MTNVYNDLFTDIIGHEWYAGTVECALQNGILSADLCKDGLFHPLEPVTLLDFTVFLMRAYGSRKSLPESCPCPYDSCVGSELRPLLSAAWQLGVLSKDGKDRPETTLLRGQGSEICGKLQIM